MKSLVRSSIKLGETLADPGYQLIIQLGFPVCLTRNLCAHWSTYSSPANSNWPANINVRHARKSLCPVTTVNVIGNPTLNMADEMREKVAQLLKGIDRYES